MQRVVMMFGCLISLILTSCITVDQPEHPLNVTNNSHYSVINIDDTTVDPVFNSVVMLERNVLFSMDGDENTGTSIATGFVIKNSKSKKGKYSSIGLSVKHFCKSNGNRLKVIKQTSIDTTETFKGKVLHIDDAADLCVFRIYNTNGKFTPLKLAKELPEMGEKLSIIGAPLGNFPSKVTGFMVRRYPVDSNMIELSIPVTGGNSGSPVYNKRFEVIGILVGVHGRFPHASVALHSEAIKNLLKETKYLQN